MLADGERLSRLWALQLLADCTSVAKAERRAILAFSLARHQPCERQARDEQR
jgi:hypothetical protein